MKKIQENRLDYIDSEINLEEKYQKLIKIFDDIKIRNNQFKIKSLFYLILKISNNHQSKYISSISFNFEILHFDSISILIFFFFQKRANIMEKSHYYKIYCVINLYRFKNKNKNKIIEISNK